MSSYSRYFDYPSYAIDLVLRSSHRPKSIFDHRSYERDFLSERSIISYDKEYLERLPRPSQSSFNSGLDHSSHDVVNMKDFLSRGTCINDKEEYLDRMQRLLGAYPNIGVPHEPSQIISGVFLGTTADTDNARLLRRLTITHVINCSAPVRSMKIHGMRKLSAVHDGMQGYMGLDIEDHDDYNISVHFKPVSKYIKKLRETGGKVLIVGSGTSSASALVIAYLIIVKRKCLLEATQMVKNCRPVALTNVNFMRHLVDLAAEEEMLDKDPEKFRIPKFARGIDKARLYTAHLPDIYLISSRPYAPFKPNIKSRDDSMPNAPFYRPYFSLKF